MRGRKMSIVIPTEVNEWLEFKAYQERTSLTAYIIGRLKADYESASPEELAKFEAAKATRDALSDDQQDASNTDE